MFPASSGRSAPPHGRSSGKRTKSRLVDRYRACAACRIRTFLPDVELLGFKRPIFGIFYCCHGKCFLSLLVCHYRYFHRSCVTFAQTEN